MNNYIPQEVKNLLGFYEITGYNRYCISMDGVVINKVTNTTLSGSTNPDGCINYRLTGDDGKTHTWGVHRLLGYVFKRPEDY